MIRNIKKLLNKLFFLLLHEIKRKLYSLFFIITFLHLNIKYTIIITIRLKENKFTYLAKDSMYYITYILILIQIQENQLKI